MNFFVYLKICQILHHEYIYLLALIFLVFCLKINYNASIKESDFWRLFYVYLYKIYSANFSNQRNIIVSVKDKNIELGDEYMKKRILTSLITVLGIALFSFLKNHMNVSLVMSVVISSIFIVLGVLIIEFRYNK